MSSDGTPSAVYEQLALIKEELSISEHPLLQVEPREEGGVTAQFKFGYQLELATYACIQMLFPESGIVSVAVELHEDYVVEFDDGHFDFRQVKHKDEGQVADLGTLAEPIHNLYEHFKKYPQAGNVFTIQCNRGAHSSKRPRQGGLLELKDLLVKKRRFALDPKDEDRLMLLKSALCQLLVFRNEDPESVNQFVEQLGIRTDEDSEEAFKNKSWQALIEMYRRRYRTTNVDIKVIEDLYRNIRSLVDQASRARDDREKRIIRREAVEALVHPMPNLAELVDPIPIEKERRILDDPDPNHTILEGKCHVAGLDDIVDNLKGSKVDARLRNDHYREDNCALNYIDRIRAGIKRNFDDTDFRCRAYKKDHDRSVVYSETMDALRQYARDEANNGLVRVDFEYFRGLYAQLVSECPIYP
jgi:hypothetical protein